MSSEKTIQNLTKKFAKRETPTILAAIFAITLSSGTTLYLGHIAGEITTDHPAALPAIIAVFTIAFSSMLRYAMTGRIAALYAHTLRIALYEHILSTGPQAIPPHNPSALIHTLNTDIETIEESLRSNIPLLIRYSILFIGSVIAILAISPIMAIVMIIPTLLSTLPTYALKKMVRKGNFQSNNILKKLTSLSTQTIQDLRTIQSWNEKEKETTLFNETANSYLSATLKRNNIKALSICTNIILLAVAGLIVVFAFKGLISHQYLTKQSLASGLFYCFFAANSAMNIGENTSEYHKITIKLKNIAAIFAAKNPVPAPKTPALPANLKSPPSIRLENICFSYPNTQQILHNINLSLEPGSSTGIIGPSGSGKSTLAAIITRELEPTAGTIFVDGTPHTNIDPESYRRMIATLPQSVTLFNRPIRDIITYGLTKNVPDEEIHRALSHAHALFIQKLPHNIQTLCGENGNRLSGGQKQRILIARIFASQRQMLVLDEPNSAIDPETESVIIENMRHLQENRTTFIIAHHKRILTHCTKIYTIADGHLFPSPAAHFAPALSKA